jgi:PAS domain S-box-containing protein
VPNMKAMSRTMRIDLIPDVPAGRLDGDRRHPVVVSSGATEGVRNAGLPSHEVDEHQSRYRELLQSIYDAALITDLDGVILESNARASEFLQWASDELEGKSVSLVISGADASLIDTLCTNLESERYTLIQAYCIRQDGTRFPSEIAVNRIRVGEGTLCFFVRDITIRRQAEEMLRTEHAAIQNAANGIVIADLNANLEYVNPAFASMLGYGHPDALSCVSVRNVVGDGESTDLMLEHVLEHGLTWTGEMQVVKPDGDVVDLEVLATCNRNSEGETVGIVFSFTDLSDRIRAEAALRETERQRVMLESLGAACHHLGQPATVLTANLELIKSRLNSSDQLLCDLVDHSITATERLGQVLRKLKTVNEYRTTRYMGNNTDDNDESRILEI